MDFRYSEEQLALQDTLQKFISREYDFAQRRVFARTPLGYSAEAWDRYAGLGLLALPFPEEFGGLGGSCVDIMVVMAEMGQGLLLEPYLSTVVLCGGLIRDAATSEMKHALLPPIAAGKCRIALAAYEARGRFDLAHVACSAVDKGGRWRLSGRKDVVLDAPSADYFIVSARTRGAVNDVAGISLFLVPRAATGLTMFEYATQSGGKAADLQLTDVTLSSESVIGAVGQGFDAVQRAVDSGIAALSAEALGIVTALNLLTLNYLKTRKQFGVPIGTFQVLQHRMADMYIAAEQTRSMAIIAALQVDGADSATRTRTLSGVKAYVGEAIRFVGQQAVQLHGAMGVVDEMIVGHYFKRLTMIDMCFGDADYHLARFSDAASFATDPE